MDKTRIKNDIINIVLSAPSLLDKHIDFFDPMYYKGEFKIYVEVIKEMYFNAEDINELSFISELRKKAPEKTKDAMMIIAGETRSNVSMLPTLLMIQVQEWAADEAMKVGANLSKSMHEIGADSFQVISEAKEKLDALINFKAIEPTKTSYQAAKELIENLKKGKRNGVTTGLQTLDKIIGGWIGGKLTIIAGRPGMGKSVLATFFAYNAAMIGKRVLLFTLEMSNEELMGRVMSLHIKTTQEKVIQYSHIDKYTLRQDEIEELELALPEFYSMPLLLDDNPSSDIDSIVSKAIVENSKESIDMVIIDYLGLISNNKSFSRKDLEIADISRKLKNLSKSIDAPVIALSQLNRKVEDRPDKRPSLSDLRDSGSLEQDADIVIFPFRPEYYGFTQDTAGNSLVGKIQIGIAKQRGGVVMSLQDDSVPTFEIDLRTNFIKEISDSVFSENTTQTPKKAPF